jgi:CO/xanthine dehydrogenase FAD-binding subunit
MPELKALYQPATLVEALALLEEHGERARPLAGGTSLALSKGSKVDALVDLGRIGLDRVTRNGDGLHVGAMVTCAALRRALKDDPPGALGDAAGSVGSRILQNHVTVGGNCVAVYAWSDLPLAMLALEASFVIQGQGDRRRVLPAESFFAEHPTRHLVEGEILVEVTVPGAHLAKSGSAHLKFARNATDQALASVAVCLELGEGVISRARVVVGAVRGMPQLLRETSDGLLGARPDAEHLARAAASASREAKVSSDYRASGEHRTVLVGALVEDALQLAVARAGEIG